MSTVARVILDSATLTGVPLSNLSLTRFAVRDRKYYRIECPDAELILRARSAIQSGLSAAVIEESTIKPQAMFFDMDGTVIEEESLVEISKAAGKERQVRELTEKAMAGSLDFSESLRERLKILAGLTMSQVNSVSPTICQGMTELAAWCHSQKIPIFLISGGFVELADPISKTLGFTDFRANRFSWDRNIMQGEVVGEIINAQGKKNNVLNWCNKHNINPKEAIAVGDGANDLEMLKACGLAVGFRPKTILWPHLQVANHTGDHRFLLEALR